MFDKFFARFFRKKTVLFSYISVLLAVLLIPTVFGCIVSSYSMSAAMEQINIRTQESANHIGITLDAEISAAMQAAVSVANNSSLHSFAIKIPGKDYAFDVSKNNFASAAKTLPGIYKLFISFNDANLIIDDTFLHNPSVYIKEVLNITDMKPEDFARIITSAKSAGILPAQTFGAENSGTARKCITYVQPFPLKGEPKGQVVVLIDCDKLFAPFKKDFESGDTCFYIMNNKNELIFSIGNGDYISAEASASGITRDTVKINGQKVTYQVKPSDWVSLKYVYACSDKSAEKSVFPLKMSIALYALLVITFGTALIVWLAHRNTKPLRELSGLIDKSFGTDDGKNEFENLNVAIKNILNEKLRLSSVLEAGESSLKKDTISSILRGGSMSIDSVLKECKNNGISFVSDDFCVAYFNLSEITSSDVPIIKYAISNTVSEIFSPIAEVFIDDSDNVSLPVIINPRSLTDETQDQILSHLGFLRTFFLEQFSATINVGVGDMVSGVKSIPSSYVNAKEAAEYSALTGATDVMPYGKIKTKDYYYFYPLETEGKLLASVMNGDIWQVKQIIDHVVEANSMLSLDMSRCLFFDLTATALKIMSNKTIDLSAIFGDSDSPFTRLMQCKSIKELIDTIHVIFEKICMQITDGHSIKKEKLKVTITDFVKRNYTNPNMSLAMVADEFSMNYTYMSHFFKDYIGSNFIDYISDLRVKKAAELLRTTNLAIGDIATEVGYANATVLIKIFKKVTDTTPGAYRKSTREENK